MERGRLSPDPFGVREPLCDGGGLSAVLDAIAVARRISLSPMLSGSRLADGGRLGQMPRLRVPGVCHGGNDLSSKPPSAAHMVSGNVVGDQSEAGGERVGSSPSLGLGQLQNRLVLFAQAAARHGSPGPGRIERGDRGG